MLILGSIITAQVGSEFIKKEHALYYSYYFLTRGGMTRFVITAGWSFAFEELGERAVAGPFVSVQLTVNTAGRVSTDGSWCRPPCRG